MKYFRELSELVKKTEIVDGKKRVSYEDALDKVVRRISALRGNTVFIVGNGGSASTASHIATDLLKNAGVSALAFNDPSLLTCISNDLGYERVFEKPMGMVSRKGDILIAISSSGRSSNILNAAALARRRGCFVITMSGFDSANPLRAAGDMNFYVPSRSYGFVEIAHLGICHNVVDELIARRSNVG